LADSSCSAGLASCAITPGPRIRRTAASSAPSAQNIGAALGGWCGAPPNFITSDVEAE